MEILRKRKHSLEILNLYRKITFSIIVGQGETAMFFLWSCVIAPSIKNISFVVPTICEHAYEFIIGPAIAMTFILAFL